MNIIVEFGDANLSINYKELLDLAAVDRRITILSVQNEDLLKQEQGLAKRVKDAELLLSNSNRALLDAEKVQRLEEERLKEEEARIVLRRKQISAMGGAKSAKVAEREVDVASRAIESLEADVINRMQETEGIKNRVAQGEGQLEGTRLELAAHQSSSAEVRGKNDSELLQLRSKRAELVTRFDQTVIRLYDRIRTKYPAEPVALVEKAGCKACLRSLPPQILNQLVAGTNPHQCPGCGRVLVWIEESSES